MSSVDWLEDDREEKVDLRLWKTLLQYTLHYRRTAVTFCLVALGLAVTDLCFPLLTGKLISEIEEGVKAGTSQNIDLAFYGWAYAGLTLGLCLCIWAFIACAGKIPAPRATPADNAACF